MKCAILACATLQQELKRVMEDTACSIPVIWLEAGDHNSPLRRREAITAALEHCGGFDTVLLAMTLCGGALEGICCPDKTLVLPCCDDCRALLLGSRESVAEHGDLYLLSAGWMSGKGSILREYEHCLETYGEKRTARIFGEMFRNYRGIGLIRFPWDEDAHLERARNFAGKLGLPLVTLPGSTAYLRALLEGKWDPERFRVFHPGQTLTRWRQCAGGEGNV